MNRKRLLGKIGFLQILSLSWLSVGLPVYAADTGNAVQDILLSDRFNGAMSSIEAVTNFIDIWFIRIITITAFFIIMSSVLKNVAAGAVCAFPKFWRRVHEAHEKHMLQGMLSKTGGLLKGLGKGSSAGQTGGGSPGSLADALFAIIPDFMAITEFADTDISPKQYWMKAIPEMIAACCIGVFIYNGLYRDTLATVSEAGSNIISNVLASADPDEMTNFIFNNIKEPKNSFAEDPSIRGQQIYRISQEMYRKINAKSTTYSKTEEGKQALMGFCETWAQQYVTAMSNDIFVANEAYYYNMSSPTVNILTVQPSDVMPNAAEENLYFSHAVPMGEVVNGDGAEGDYGLFPGGQDTLFIQVSANFSLAARDGKTINSTITAIEGTLTNTGSALPNSAVTVDVTGISGAVKSDSADSGYYLDLKDSDVAMKLKDAIFQACIAGADDTTVFGCNGDSLFSVQQYGKMGEVGCKYLPFAGNSATANITISYTYTPKGSNGTTGKPMSKTQTVSVTFTYSK